VAVREVVERLIGAAGADVEPDIQGHGKPAGEIDRQWLDSTAIRSELGWEPKWELDAGLVETYGWYLQHLS
jgi:nucleoside-diphosphate-sugar epimerase